MITLLLVGPARSGESWTSPSVEVLHAASPTRPMETLSRKAGASTLSSSRRDAARETVGSSRERARRGSALSAGKALGLGGRFARAGIGPFGPPRAFAIVMAFEGPSTGPENDNSAARPPWKRDSTMSGCSGCSIGNKYNSGGSYVGIRLNENEDGRVVFCETAGRSSKRRSGSSSSLPTTAPWTMRRSPPSTRSSQRGCQVKEAKRLVRRPTSRTW